MKTTRFLSMLLAAGLAALLAPVAPALAQTETTFTYQGRLDFQGAPYSGTADCRFTLWDTQTDGGQIGVELALNGASVGEGLFDADLDFGADALSGQRWLQIAVRTPAWDGQGEEPPFTTLDPRQPITRSPYSIHTRGIFVNETGDRVGIGTAAPGSALEVTGGVRARGGAPGPFGGNNNGYAFFGNGGDNDSGMFSTADGLLQLFTNNMERLRIMPNGNVGIGTANPTQRLHIGGTPGVHGIRFPDGTLQTTAATVQSDEQLLLVRGVVSFSQFPGGQIIAGSGFTHTVVSPGVHRIIFNQPWASAPSVTVAPQVPSSFGATAVPEPGQPPNGSIWQVRTFNTTSGVLATTGFSLIAVGVAQ